MKTLFGDWKLMLAVGGGTLAAVAMIVYAFFRPAEDPEEAERRREVERRALAEEETRRKMKSRRVGLAALVLGMLALAFAGVGGWAYQQSLLATSAASSARTALAEANTQKNDAEVQRKRAEGLAERARQNESAAEQS